MLFVVLILVLAALGALVTALVTGTPLWAWASIALSVLAAVSLFVDWLLRRRKEPAADEEAANEEEEAGESAEGEEPGEEAEAEGEPAAEIEAETEADTETEAEEPAEDVGEEEPAEQTVIAADIGELDADQADLDAVPDEEDTDAADLLIVCDLDDQVIVVDEHPRYHLPECGWLVDRDTIPIAVSEARELGFTPCIRCGPDAFLAEKSRKKRKKASWLSRE